MEAEKFLARIMVLNHPGEIKNGYTPVMDIHTAHVPCKFAKIIRRMDRRTGSVLEEEPSAIKS